MVEKKKRGIVLLILSAMLVLCFAGVRAKADNGNIANRYNVVLVIDASDSMDHTDPDAWRYESIDLFLSLLTNTGNNVGAVVFNHDILYQQDITPVNGVADKKTISQSIQSAGVQGDTNIGKAIETAVGMLEAQGDSNLPSAIVLMSDGNTDFTEVGDKSGEKMEAALASKENAIQKCIQNGYPIYSICLNQNNGANPDELEDLSLRTGGESMVVKKAKDLKDVYTQFYNMIYGTSTTTVWDQDTPADGVIEVPFTIPSLGVEEVNIIITTNKKLQSVTLTQPSGIPYSQDEIDKLKMEGNTFTLIKIAEPEAGPWILTAKGIPGDHVKIDMIYNADFSVNNSIANAKSQYIIDEEITVDATISVEGNEVTDAQAYKEYSAVLQITNLADNFVEEVPMQQGTAGYTVKWKAVAHGAYSARVKIESAEGNFRYGAAMQINVDNGAPVAAENPMELTVERTLFKRKGSVNYDISSAAVDPEGGAITWSIASSDYDADVAYVQGTELVIDIAKAVTGKLALSAADDVGSSTTIEVNLAVKDSGKIIMIILVVLLVVLALVLLILLIRKANRRYRGDIMVQAFDNNANIAGVPQTQSPLKGKYALWQFIENGYGVDVRRSHFVPSGKDYIYFVGGKGYFTDMSPEKRVKKIRIDANFQVIVSDSDDCSSGIKITFMPYN